ncbi:hypothetical protein KR009_010031 [Drosophila setifemur]|nr:hypothetical protein KR009_010031 [Drosophila setifemur]
MKIQYDHIFIVNSSPLNEISQAYPSSSFQAPLARKLRLRQEETLPPETPPPKTFPRPRRFPQWRKVLTLVKIFILLVGWTAFTYLLMMTDPKPIKSTLIVIMPNSTVLHKMRLMKNAAKVILHGPIDKNLTEKGGQTEKVPAVGVRLEWHEQRTGKSQMRTDIWNVYLDEQVDTYRQVERVLQVAPVGVSEGRAVISLVGINNDPVSLVMEADVRPLVSEWGVIYSFLLFIVLYILIVFGLVDRTFAILFVATSGIALLTAFGDRPHIYTIVSWVDFQTLMLLLGKMIMADIFADSGFFDWLAVFTYRVSKGHPWLLIWYLALFTAGLSSVVDNVTMMHLMAPIAIRLGELMALRCSLILIVVIVFTEIGGMLTPIGDPPNTIIATSQALENEGINFIIFFLHMLPGVLLSGIVGLVIIYLTMRKSLFTFDEDQEHLAKQHEMTNAVLKDEVHKRIKRMQRKQSKKPFIKPSQNYFVILATLDMQYGIKNKPLLIKCLVAMTITLVCFIMQGESFMYASLGWVAMMGAFLLLILANMNDMNDILAQVEWSGLLFLAASFVLMESVEQLGFIHFLAERFQWLIRTVDNRHQAPLAIVLTIWISSFLAAVVGNVPVTTIMLKLITDVAQCNAISVTLPPLLYSLGLGACLGANATLIGASANVVAGAIANQYGYRISFKHYFRYGFPVMLATVIATSIYLVLVYDVFEIHELY